MSKIVADILVEKLVAAGIKRIYAVTGDSLNHINDAVRRDGRLTWIHVRHEEAGAYAASMDAELDGIGCCMGSSGPGHVHLINGLYDANRSGNSVFVIASTIATNKLGTDNFQETNVTKLFDDCTKYCFMANTPEQAITAFQTGLQHCISKKGVSVVGLPGDVAAADAIEVSSSNHNFYTSPYIIPNKKEMEELAEIINSSSKVMIYCGYGSKNAQKEVLELAEKLNAPIAFSYRGKIFYDKETNPYAIGLNGLLGSKAGFKAMHEADLVLMLGSDFPYSEFLPEENKFVQIDISPEKIGRRGKVDHGYCGDIQQTICLLLPQINDKSNKEFLVEMLDIHKKIESDYQAYVEKKGAEDLIHPEFVASLINDLADDDAIFTVDTGMSAVWAARYIKGKTNRYLTGSFNHGSMANAMPMAIGAGLSYPKRQAIAFCGDGGITMLLGDLMTISQYQIPVKIIVFNNRSIGMVKLEMQVQGIPDWQTDMVNPDFEKVAEAMNIKAWTVHKNENLKQSLIETLAHEGPALISIFTDPNALAMPPHITFDQISGMTEALSKMMFNGDTTEVVDIMKSGTKYLRELL